MSKAPADSSINGGGFRFYRWEPSNRTEDQDALVKYGATEPADVLSVTSIRKLCGEQYNLVSWQIANVLDVALGTQKRTVIGPKGGVSETRLYEGDFPHEFAARLLEAEGKQGPTDKLRAWARAQADQPRNIAAARGTIVHEAIELGVDLAMIQRPYVELAFSRLSDRDKRKAAEEVTDDDVNFVVNCMRNYEALRRDVPFVILAQEPQVWNLKAGYAGSTDVLIWFLPPEADAAAVREWQVLADRRQVTQDMIAEVGGYTVLGDWKTSPDVYTDQIVQITAYLAAEFIGTGGVVDARLTDILTEMKRGAIIQIRPDKWAIHNIDYGIEVVAAFLGSCMFARFLAKYPKPHTLFTDELTGSAT